MLTEQEEQAERDYWNERQWEKKFGMDYFHTIIRTENGRQVEYHYSGSHLMGKYDHYTGRAVK